MSSTKCVHPFGGCRRGRFMWSTCRAISRRFDGGGQMKKIAILNCRNAICVCAGASCLHALNSRTGKFGRYEGEEVELCAFWYCNGCDMPDDDAGLREKIDRVKSFGIESMHLGVCTRLSAKEGGGECPVITKIADEFEKEGVEIIRGTHPTR